MTLSQCIIEHHSHFVYRVVKHRVTVWGHCLLTCGQRQVKPANTRYAWLRIVSGTMAANSPLVVLGLESLNIKRTYRTLAKRYHADKWVHPEANTTLKWLNNAHQDLMNKMCIDNDNQMIDDDDKWQDDAGNNTAQYNPVHARKLFFFTTDNVYGVSCFPWRMHQTPWRHTHRERSAWTTIYFCLYQSQWEWILCILSLTFYLTTSRLVTTGYLVYPMGITPADREFDKNFGHTTAGISQENDENVRPKQLWSKLNQLFQNNTQLAEILQHMVCRMWRDTFSACSLYLDSCI